MTSLVRKPVAALAVAALLASAGPGRAGGLTPLYATGGVIGGLALGGIALAIAKKRAACRADPACRGRLGVPSGGAAAMPVPADPLASPLRMP